MLIYDPALMTKLDSDLRILTGMRFSLWDEKQNMIFPLPGFPADFCEKIAAFPERHALCDQSNCFGFAEAKRTGRISIYHCHIGLTEAVAPINYEGQIIGYIMLGQTCDRAQKQKVLQNIEKLADEYHVDAEDLKRDFACIPVVSSEQILASAHIIEVVASYLHMNSVVGVRKETDYLRFKEYVASHLSSHISIADICDALNTSKSSLYNLIMDHSGMSVTAFIRKERIEMAKKLLLETGYPLSVIGEKVGLPDYNYFIKVFRTEVGISPYRFQKQQKKLAESASE